MQRARVRSHLQVISIDHLLEKWRVCPLFLPKLAHVFLSRIYRPEQYFMFSIFWSWRIAAGEIKIFSSIFWISYICIILWMLFSHLKFLEFPFGSVKKDFFRICLFFPSFRQEDSLTSHLISISCFWVLCLPNFRHEEFVQNHLSKYKICTSSFLCLLNMPVLGISLGRCYHVGMWRYCFQ